MPKMIANNQNLKNFIRHGKQAAVQSPDAVVVDQKLEVHHKPNKEAYDQAVKQIIKEENEQRQRLPRYQGLKEDRFQLIEKIGDGAFSVVYRALDKKDGAQVAVKIIRKQDLSNSQVSENPPFICFSDDWSRTFLLKLRAILALRPNRTRLLR